jgi:hypothetical protein
MDYANCTEPKGATWDGGVAVGSGAPDDLLRNLAKYFFNEFGHFARVKRPLRLSQFFLKESASIIYTDS